MTVARMIAGTTHGSARCFFVPPHVQREVAKNTDGPAAAKKQLDLAEASRKNRASAITKVDGGPEAAPALAPAPTGTSRREVYDLQHGTTQRVNLVRDEGRPETDDVDVTNAYDNAGLVRRFLTTVFERESIDNRALDLVLNVHFSTSYNNAFWDGDEMTFGDGDGVVFSGFAPLARRRSPTSSGHGVTQFTSGAGLQERARCAQRALQRRVRHDRHPVGQRRRPRRRRTGSSATRSWARSPRREALRSMRAPGTAYDNPVLGTDPQPAHLHADTLHRDGGLRRRAHQLRASRTGRSTSPRSTSGTP